MNRLQQTKSKSWGYSAEILDLLYYWHVVNSFLMDYAIPFVNAAHVGNAEETANEPLWELNMDSHMLFFFIN